MNKNEYITLLNGYVDHAYFINDLYIAYNSLIQTAKVHNDKINRAPGFFTLSRYAISKTFILELSKMYRNGSDNERTLKKLISVTKANQQLFVGKSLNYYNNDKQNIKQILECANNFICLQQHTINNLMSQRDKSIAHNDKKYFLGDVQPYEDFPLDIDSVEELIKFLCAFLNTLLNFLGENLQSFETVGSDDLIYLFDKVRY